MLCISALTLKAEVLPLKQPQLPISNDLPLIPALKNVMEWGAVVNRSLLHEPLVAWAGEEWKKRFGSMECLVLWASGECGNRLALTRVKPGRKLASFGQYVGFEPISCPLITPTNWRASVKGEGIVPSAGSGALLFTFSANGQKFPVLYASVNYHDFSGNVR